MSSIKFFYGESVPVETHKVRIVQKLNLIDINKRYQAIEQAGWNNFLLQSSDVFLDMLTDSGVNAMSDMQLSAMMRADDSYAGSATFARLETTIRKIFGMEYFLPAHQGRACENIISQTFISEEKNIVPMNYHFTTSKAHIVLNGGQVEEFLTPEGLKITSNCDFKGNMNNQLLKETIAKHDAAKIAFVRFESGTNLIGGQPHSLENLIETYKICKENNLLLVYDASLLADNLYFIKMKEANYHDKTIAEIILEIAKHTDIIYFSARKLGCARGGGICTNNLEAYNKMRVLIPLFEGFLTYGGMSCREIEAITVGLEETLDFDFISQSPIFIKYMVDELEKNGIPVVTPAGGLGCHLNASDFVPHIKQSQYPAGALSTALYLIAGIRGMERGSISMDRDINGIEHYADMELLRLALPKRVFTLSQIKYAIDRIKWLYANRELIGGLTFSEEPKTLRFFLGKLKPLGNWPEKLITKFKSDYGDF